jgi:hypothetical protein
VSISYLLALIQEMLFTGIDGITTFIMNYAAKIREIIKSWAKSF